jgi:ribonuclease P protein component
VKGTIKRRRDFEAVYDRGQRAFGDHVVVFALRPEATAAPIDDGNLPPTRLGIVASRKVGGAVRRSRAKRVLRAAIRPLLAYVPRGSWLVLVARRGLAEPAVRSHDVQRELRELLVRLELLEDGSV